VRFFQKDSDDNLLEFRLDFNEGAEIVDDATLVIVIFVSIDGRIGINP